MKKLLTIFVATVFLASCVDNLEDYNENKKKAEAAPPEALFTSALKNLADALTTPSVNSNNFRLYVQFWTTTDYLQEPRYDLTSRTIPQALWQSIYRDVIADLREAKRILNADQFIDPALRTVQLAQIEVIEVYAWSVLVNTFGNVPYKQALDYEQPLPEYDDAEEVYHDLLSRLDVAINDLDTTEAGAGFGEGDVLYYAGSNTQLQMKRWRKFSNSIMIKLAMNLADIDAGTVKPLIEKASTYVLESNADNARFPYVNTPPNNNPISTNLNVLFTSRQDFVPAETIVDPMKERNDPRLSAYFTLFEDEEAGTAEYIGGKYGFRNDYATLSHVHEEIIAPDFEALLLDYSEVRFLLAEAVERGFAVGGTATEHYNKAVTASIEYWGGTADDATNYLADPKVNYATAASTWQEKIGMQKWIALYNRGWDAWVEWKRLDAPTLLPPVVENSEPLHIPVRLIYPINEQTLNGANRAKAAEDIGGDLATTKLFWDIH